MPRWRDDSGANAVEFALLLPILIMLLFGVISGGLLWNQQLTVTQAAREGARYGATVPIEGGWSDAVVERVEEASGGVVDTSEPGHLVEADPDYGDGRIRVLVQVPGSLDVIFWARDLTTSSEAIARHEDVEP